MLQMCARLNDHTQYLQALVNAEKEEDTLTSQLEKEQTAALEAAESRRAIVSQGYRERREYWDSVRGGAR